MSADNISDGLTLLATLILSGASWRAHRWAQKQARIADKAAQSVAAQGHAAPAAGPTASNGSAAEFDQALNEVASAPYFDKWAFLFFLIGFLMSAASASIQLLVD